MARVNSIMPAVSTPVETPEKPTNENLLFVLFSLVGLSLIKIDFTVILISVILIYMLYINSRPYVKLIMERVNFRELMFGCGYDGDDFDTDSEDNDLANDEQMKEEKVVTFKGLDKDN